VAVALLIGSTGPMSSEADSEFVHRFLEFERAVAACEDVGCYRTVLQEHGSRGTRQRVAQASPEQIQQIFDIEKPAAAYKVSHANELEVNHIDVAGETATLVLRDRTHPGFVSTVYFVKEQGVWKIGTHEE